MSNALAIAHVTQALALLIENNVGPEFGEAVKVEPRKPPADPQLEQPTISVFLYQVTPNTSQRNNDLPTRAADGTLVKRPAAALDLHYVISAYGDERELVGQRLIGSVVRTLHEIPVLPKDVIELAGERPYLAGSDLAAAAQRVRFTPTVMDVDETSKLWGDALPDAVHPVRGLPGDARLHRRTSDTGGGQAGRAARGTGAAVRGAGRAGPSESRAGPCLK